MAKKIKSLSCLLVLLVGVMLPASAFGLAASGMSIAPEVNAKFPDRKGWFIYEEVEPGAVIEDAARVINLGDKPNTITIEAVDALMTPDGGFALIGEPKNNTDIGNWIELTKTEVTLAPNKEQIIPFKIKVPEDAEVGDHIGALAVYRSNQETEGTIKAGGAQVSISTRVGARIYLTVKGNITRQLTLLKRAMYGRGQKLIFYFKMENLGNIRAEVAMTTKIYSIWGLYDSKENISIGQIFPKQTTTIETTWPGKGRPIFGPYLALITLEDTFQGLNPAQSTMPPPAPPIHTWALFFFIPYTQMAVLLILLFLIWFIIQARRWRQMARLAQMRVVAHRVKRGDHLVDIAAHYGISWKLLAQLNEIKPPYDFKETKTIYVPDRQGQCRYLPVPNILAYLFAQILHPGFFFRHPELDSGSPGSRFRLGGRNDKAEPGMTRGRSDRMTKGVVIKPTSYTIIIQPGDTRKDVEQFTGLAWKKIVKFNRLKPKFRLKAGLELEVPEQDDEK